MPFFSLKVWNFFFLFMVSPWFSSTHVFMHGPILPSFIFYKVPIFTLIRKAKGYCFIKLNSNISDASSSVIMEFQITSPSCITGDTHCSSSWSKLGLLHSVTIIISTSSYRCLSRPQPGGSRSRRVLCRTRRHRDTSSQGWWVLQSQPVPHRWGTLSISSEREIKKQSGKMKH